LSAISSIDTIVTGGAALADPVSVPEAGGAPEGGQRQLHARAIERQVGVFDPPGEQRAERGPDMQLLHRYPRRTADRHIGEIHGHAREDRGSEAADGHRLPERRRELRRHRLADAVARQDRSGPQVQAAAQRDDDHGANDQDLAHGL
jgi:hypothetical protein